MADDFSSRIYSANVNSQVALDQETFLNIVRATRYQPLSFVAISKVSGQQSDTLNVGLPTFTLGPFQTPANRLYQFGNNSVSANVQGNFDSNPLISSAFQEGMMSPISQRVLAQLLGSHRRELVALAVVAGIRLTNKQGRSYFFKNDPSNNYYPVRSGSAGQYDSQVCLELEEITPDNKKIERLVTAHNVQFELDCVYSMFIHYLRYGLDLGLTADIISRSSLVGSKLSEAEVSKYTNAVNTPAPPGRLCFDAALARPIPDAPVKDFKYYSSQLEPKCRQIGSKSTGKSFSFYVQGSDFQIDVVLRSPLGVYNYLGDLIRHNVEERVRVRTEISDIEEFRPFVDISEDTANCLIRAASLAGYVCDTETRSRNTLALVSMLQQLRNLMIQPVDLNSSFSVRLAP